MTKVSLRKKAISKGRHSLYLDFYPAIKHPDTGKMTRREFLKMYVLDKPKGALEKQHNKETLAMAEAIRAKRQIALQYDEHGFLSKSGGKQDFVAYFEYLADKRTASTNNYGNWKSTLNYLRRHTGGSIEIRQVDEEFCRDFRDSLLTDGSIRNPDQPLSRNAASSYYNKFRAALKQAVKDKLIRVNPAQYVDPIKPEDTKREFLSLEELKAVAATECRLPALKNASLFSCMTGLRYSDITKMVWGEIRYSETAGHLLRYRMKKTAAQEDLPLSPETVALLGERGADNERVFPTLPKKLNDSQNDKLKAWIKAAGIDRHITFHCFRHTFATLQLGAGTDIYTVSKLLGHKNVQTTAIYTKVIDEKKREAMNRISLK
ncbi:MAG: site-specific integrase [Bacteroidota bacterium]